MTRAGARASVGCNAVGVRWPRPPFWSAGAVLEWPTASQQSNAGRYRPGKVEPVSMAEFLRVYRDELDAAINRACPNIGRLNNRERRLWVLNDEGLYDWARMCGVLL